MNSGFELDHGGKGGVEVANKMGIIVNSPAKNAVNYRSTTINSGAVRADIQDAVKLGTHGKPKIVTFFAS